MMDKLTTAVGFGRLGYRTLHHLLNTLNTSVDLVCYNAELKTFDPLSGSKGVSTDSTYREPFAAGGSLQKDIFVYVIDIEEYQDLHSIYAHSSQARDRGSFTVALAAAPLHCRSSCEAIKLEAALQDLSKKVDAVIVISNKANGTSPPEAVAAIIQFLDSVTTKKHPDKVSVDFEDLKYILQDTGFALAGISEESGKDRANRLVSTATTMPYMSASLWAGSSNLLMNVTSGTTPELEMDELEVMTESVQALLGVKEEIFFGYELDDTLGDKVRLQLIVPVSIINQ